MVDPRTPVIVGVGQFTERIDLDGYRGMSSVELATEAAKAALHDCGADTAAVAQAIDTVAGTRQFEISGPQTPTLGISNNYPRSVARNVGAEPARAILEVIGGQSPQHLVTEFSAAIAKGEADVVMLFGSENTSTLRHFSKRDDKPDHPRPSKVSWRTAASGTTASSTSTTIKHGLIGAPVQYGLLENARRARLGLSVADYRTKMAELFAPSRKWLPRTPIRRLRWSVRSRSWPPSPRATG